jgi:hypothetical protein
VSSFRRHFGPIAIGAALAVALTLPIRAWAGSVDYALMAPLSQYLMDRQAEISLAQSAAPPAISLKATVLVLGPHGYETAVKGSNGFTCLVERSWMSPFSSTEFWNWKMRGPICYNPAASHTVLLYTLRRTDRALAGQTKTAMLAGIQAAVDGKTLPAPEPGSMAYMLSKVSYLGDGVGAWRPHLMLYAPAADSANDGASWGANEPGSPVDFDTGHHIVPEPETIFMVPVAHWSDGTAVTAK